MRSYLTKIPTLQVTAPIQVYWFCCVGFDFSIAGVHGAKTLYRTMTAAFLSVADFKTEKSVILLHLLPCCRERVAHTCRTAATFYMPLFVVVFYSIVGRCHRMFYKKAVAEHGV